MSKEEKQKEEENPSFQTLSERSAYKRGLPRISISDPNQNEFQAHSLGDWIECKEEAEFQTRSKGQKKRRKNEKQKKPK